MNRAVLKKYYFAKNVIHNITTKNYVTAKYVNQYDLDIDDMPHPTELPFIGTKLDFLRAGRGTKLHTYIDQRHKQLGPLFYEKMGDSKIVFTSDPFLMKTLFINLEGKTPMHILPDPWVLYEKLYGSKRGLFFMNGEEWLTNRRVLNKYILRESNDNSLRLPIQNKIREFVENWKTNKSAMEKLESELYRLSIDVVVAILLGSKNVIKTTRHHEELLEMFSETVKNIFHTTTKLSGMPLNVCHKLNLKVWRDFKESVDKSLYLAHKLVMEMIININDHSGLVQKLIQENIELDIVKRIIADFIIAAGDTTAYTTLWTLLLLSNEKEIVNDLRSNVLDVKHVIKESMRIYPVAPFLTRILPKDCNFDMYKLTAGTPIVASIYTSGRDETYFSQADKFIPYRWDRNNKRKEMLPNHEPSASLPFAMGSRSCVGKKIAMIQLTEIIKQIVDNFDFELCGDKNIEPITLQVLVPNKPIQFKFTPRKT